MLKLLALGALGYAGYKYYRKQSDDVQPREYAPRQTAVAGGPISEDARLRHTPPTTA